jgi:hypothetical protein
MDDLKEMWQQYDRKLRQNQYFNELTLRKLNNKSNKNRLSQMLGVEAAGIVVVGLALLWLLFMSGRAMAASGLLILCYWLVFGVLLIALAWSIRKVVFINALDNGKLAVTEMLHRMTRLRLMLVRERLWGGIFTLVFFVVPSLVIVTFLIAGVDLTRTNHTMLLIQTAFVVLVVTPFGLWIYRRYYFDSIDEIMENLREVEQFDDAAQP